MDDILYQYWAATLQNGYFNKIREIIDKVGSEQALYEMSESMLKKDLGLGDKLISHILAGRNDYTVRSGYEYMLESGIRLVKHNDEEYPKRLLSLKDAPYALFVKGRLPSDNTPAVAVIGARECSEYGRLMAEYFGDRLAAESIDIISGMAWGIDGIAQMAALDAGGSTYAILGCGADVIYPKSNKELYRRLEENDRCGIISEYAPKTQAMSRLFPPRNRLISGLCDVLLVVEARAKSGTLITVEMAVQQSKEIMIVPGRITDPLSVGCLRLMREGAQPALSVDDVMSQLSLVCEKKLLVTDYMQDDIPYYNECIAKPKAAEAKMAKSKVPKPASPVALSAKEKEILSTLDYYPTGVESISQKCSYNSREIMIILTSLEMKGLIKEKSPGIFVLC